MFPQKYLQDPGKSFPYLPNSSVHQWLPIKLDGLMVPCEELDGLIAFPCEIGKASDVRNPKPKSSKYLLFFVVLDFCRKPHSLLSLTPFRSH